MENSAQRWTQLGSFFQNQGTFLDFQNKVRAGLPPFSPSCAPVTIIVTDETIFMGYLLVNFLSIKKANTKAIWRERKAKTFSQKDSA